MDNAIEMDAQTIDGETGRPDPTPGRLKLSSLKDVRLEMAAIYREVKRGDLEESQATKRVYILAEIGKIITVAELESRLVELEARNTPLHQDKYVYKSLS